MGMWAADRCLRKSAAPTTGLQICGSLSPFPLWVPSPHAPCQAAWNGRHASWCGRLEAEITRDTQKLLSNSGTSSVGPTTGTSYLKRAPPEPPNFLAYPPPDPSSPYLLSDPVEIKLTPFRIFPVLKTKPKAKQQNKSFPVLWGSR